LNLIIDVPYNSSGPYNVTITASGWTVQESNVTVYVNKVDPGILTAQYPATQTTQGSTVTFDLTIKNVLTKRFTAIVSAEYPTGWTGTLARADGTQLYGISLGTSEFISAVISLNVPRTATPGNYETIVSIKGEDIESSLPLNVTIVTGTPVPKLSTSTPYVDAYAGRTASYPIEVQNAGDSDGIVNLNVTGLPAGYAWNIKDAAGNVLSNLYLKAGETKDLSAIVTVPPLAEPNIISFALQANVSGTTDRLNLGLGILGYYSIAYVTQDFYLETTAGTSTIFQVDVKNTGYSSLTNVGLDLSDIPTGFTVTADPNLVLLLKPQETATFSLTVTTDADVSAGDYYVTMTLKSDQAQATALALHAYVKQTSLVVYIGAGIVVVLVVALFLIYRRYGRR